MRTFFKSVAIGVASGAATYFASVYALGYTSAFAMPHGFPLVLWEPAAVFGLGAGLVALLIHLISIRVFSPKPAVAFAAFAMTVVLALATTGLLALGIKTLAAWLLGSLLATAAHSWLRPNKSFKPKPLRGSV